MFPNLLNLKNDQTPQNSSSQTAQLIDVVNRLILPLGYEVVYLEVLTHREKTLRVFIDFAENTGKTIGIDDCVIVTRALDEPLDQVSEIESFFRGPYELEVSSPGVDRPLRQSKDFIRFAGREVRIHTFRPLTADEAGNSSYFAKNPKQKNFYGTLKGILPTGAAVVEGESISPALIKVLLAISDGPSAIKGKSKRKSITTKEKETDAPSAEISIPLPLISKANLEPQFDFGDDE